MLYFWNDNNYARSKDVMAVWEIKLKGRILVVKDAGSQAEFGLYIKQKLRSWSKAFEEGRIEEHQVPRCTITITVFQKSHEKKNLQPSGAGQLTPTQSVPKFQRQGSRGTFSGVLGNPSCPQILLRIGGLTLVSQGDSLWVPAPTLLHSHPCCAVSSPKLLLFPKT